jgi:putative hydrolase of the HAD superfamily
VNSTNGRKLILDLGGVIVDHDNAKCYQRLTELLIARPTYVDLAAFIAGQGVGVGRTTAEDLFERMRERYGSEASQAEFVDAWSCHFTLKEDVYGLLESMRGERPFVICSNTNAAHWDYLNKRYRLDGLALAAILSHEVKCEKPSAEIYLRAAAAHGGKPEDCLFVDDVKANVAAAETLGFHTHHFTEFEPFRQALES